MAATTSAGAVLGAVFSALTRVRSPKPIHSAGALLPARVVVWGAHPGTGATWLDRPREYGGIVRFSRSAGLPTPLPDVLGLALRLFDGDRPADLLLSTTGTAPLARFMLQPRRRFGRGASTCLLPYRGPDGPLLVGAFPRGRRRLPAAVEDLPESLSDRPLSFGLAVAAPAGAWRPFGQLQVGGGIGVGLPPCPVSFDPVRHPLPGLAPPDWAARLREPAYAAARRTSGRLLA